MREGRAMNDWNVYVFGVLILLVVALILLAALLLWDRFNSIVYWYTLRQFRRKREREIKRWRNQK